MVALKEAPRVGLRVEWRAVVREGAARVVARVVARTVESVEAGEVARAVAVRAAVVMVVKRAVTAGETNPVVAREMAAVARAVVV